ncbi:MAG: hypothetical protein F6K17_37700 [Okeania sp. SIO3C4]|nr:hypothetical protein [Okeania sp. SIO3C4]
MQFETKIPVKKHLKKFIAHETGRSELVLGTSNMYSAMFIVFFSRTRSHINEQQLKADRSKWTSITVKFSMDDLKRRGFVVSYESVLLFNNIVEQQFRNLLLHNISLQKQLVNNFVMKDTILSFFDGYGITEEELKYDAIVKWVHRQNKKAPAKC